MIELWDFGDPWNVVRDSVVWLGSGGNAWPKGNEDQLRLLAADWRASAVQLGPAVAGAQLSANVLIELWGGDSGAWFARAWEEVGVVLPETLFEAIGEIADSLDAAALDIEHSKLSTLLEIGIVITEIFVFAVMWWLSFGAAMAAAAVRLNVARLTVRQIFELLVSRAGASFTQRSGYASMRELVSGLRGKTLVVAAGDEAGREGIVNLLPQLIQVKVLETREEVDVHAVAVDAVAGGFGAMGAPVGDIGRTLARKIDNEAVRGLANVGADAASEWAEELLGNLGGSLATDGTFALNPPGLDQVVAGMARNYISDGARIGERVGNFARGLAGLETTQQQMERQARGMREGAVRHQHDAQRAATEARAAADVAERRAQESAAAHEAARSAAGDPLAGPAPSTAPTHAPDARPAGTHAPDARPAGIQAPDVRPAGIQAPDAQPSDAQTPAESGSPTPAPVGPGVPAPGASTTDAPNTAPQPSQGGQPIQNQGQQSEQVRLAEELATQDRVSADTAARQAQLAEQAAQDAREAAERAARAESPEELVEAVRAAAVASNEAIQARNVAAAHASIETEPATDADRTPATNPNGSDASPAADTHDAPGTGTTGPSTSARNDAPADAATPTSRGASTGTRPNSMPPGTTTTLGSAHRSVSTSPGGASRTGSGRSDNAAGTPDPNPDPSIPGDTDGELVSDTRSDADPSNSPAPSSTPVNDRPGLPTAPGGPAGNRSLGIQGRPSVPARRSRPAGELRLGGGIPAESVRPESYDPPTPAQERALDDALPRDAEGLPVIHPPLTSGWTLLTNGGGPFQVGRHNNATEVARALASTWFGRPVVAGTNRGGSSTSQPTEAWIGSPYVAQPGGIAGLDQIHAAVREAGPGAFVFVQVRIPGVETAHELAVVNEGGTVKWIDPVAGVAEALTPPYTDVESSQALLLDADGVAVSTPNTRHVSLTDESGTLPGSPEPAVTRRTTDDEPTSGYVPARMASLRTSLTHPGNLRSARDDAAIRRAVEAAAAVGGGTRPVRVDEDSAAARRRAATEAAESRPGRPERQARPRLRYAIELPATGYADAVGRTLDDLAAQGYQPIRLVDGWAAGRVGGVVSQWRDPSTGREFHLRLDTPQSRAAYDAVREWQEARRSDADPARLRNLSEQRQQALAQVQRPEGLGGIRLPGVAAPTDSRPTETSRTPDQPAADRRESAQPAPELAAAWNDEQLARLPLVTGRRAIQAVRDFVNSTPSGLEFTGDPQLGQYAEALHPENGVLKIALHGLRSGEVVVGGYRMSAESFARGLADLNRSGRISLGDRRIKLVSCYSGAGNRPAAAALARILRRKVTGVTERMWTYLDGTEVMASPDVHNGRRPAVPADGRERTFDSRGREVPSVPVDDTDAAAAPNPPVESGGGSRAGPALEVDRDDRSRMTGDRWDSYRTPDGRLHRIGDRAGTFREPGTDRLHGELDTPGTYRDESDFSLRSAETGRSVRDPLTDPRRPVRHRAAEGPAQTYRFRQSPDQTVQAVRRAAAARRELAEFRETTLRPQMELLGVSDPQELTRSNLNRTRDRLRAEYAHDPAMLAHVQELVAAAREHSDLVAEARAAEAAVPHAAALRLLADRFGLAEADVLTREPGQGPTPAREFVALGLDRSGHRLVIVDTRPFRRTRYLLPDGSLTERGTPQYVRDVLESSPQLHAQLRQNPDLLDELHRALALGDLEVELHRIEVGIDGDQQVSITTRQADLSGLALDGLADRLPPPSDAPDPALRQRLLDSARRMVDVFASRPGPYGITRIEVRDGYVEVTVESSLPIPGIHGSLAHTFRIDLAPVSTAEKLIGYQLRDDGVYEVSFAANHLDGVTAATLDQYVVRAIGQVLGEVRATNSLRFGRLRPGGPLNSNDALTNDPTPARHPRPSHADLVAVAEIDAQLQLLAQIDERLQLHADADGPLRTAIEAELRAFIESRALREGVPGAEARAELVRRHLSEPAAAVFEEHRRWWYDSDPVAAGTRYHLARLFPFGMTIEPVPVGGRTIYRVIPKGWNQEGRLSFTFEVVSGAVTDRRVGEFRGGGRERHFYLVMDRDSFNLGEPESARDLTAHYRFAVELRRILDKQIAMQQARPAQVPYRRIDRVFANLPNVVSIGVSAVLSVLNNNPLLVLRRAVASSFELFTNDAMSRRDSIAKQERKHDRALAQLPDRSGIADGELQRRIDNSYDQAGELAMRIQGDRALAERAVPPEPEKKPDTAEISEQEEQNVRGRVREGIASISQKLASDPIEYLRGVSFIGDRTGRLNRRRGSGLMGVVKGIGRPFGEAGLRQRRRRSADMPSSDDSYELEVEGGVGVVVYVEVAHTADPDKIEVEYTEERITLRVSPKMAEADGKAMRTALRDALTAVAKRQHELTQYVTSGRIHLERRAAEEAPISGLAWPLGNWAINGYGHMQAAAGMAKALMQMLADRFAGRRDRELAAFLEEYDLTHAGRLSAAQRRNVGAQVEELAKVGGDLAGAVLDRLEGGRRDAPAATSPAEEATRTEEDGRTAVEKRRAIWKLRSSIEWAIFNLNDRHGLSFSSRRMIDEEGRFVGVICSEADSGRIFERTRRVYRYVSGLYRRADIEVQFTFGKVEDGRPVVPTGDRTGRNSFKFTVNVDADPDQVVDAINHLMDNVLYDRKNPISRARWFREDLLPALFSGIGGGVLTAFVVGSLPLGVVTAITVFSVAGRAAQRVKQVHDNDLSFVRSLSETNKDNTPPERLREKVEKQRAAVEQLEQEARRIETELAADPRTADDVARLREQFGQLPPADGDVLPKVDAAVAEFDELPRGGVIARVRDAEHTFRLAFRGAANRPEQLTFEIRSGIPGAGVTVAAHRVDSDVTYVLHVDPAQTPERIADAIQAWAQQEIIRISQQPTGLPSPKIRWLRFARDAVGQAMASGVRLVEAKIRDKPWDKSVKTQTAYSINTSLTTGVAELAGISYEGNEAVSAQNRGELAKRRLSTTGEEHLAIFGAEVDTLLTRTRWAFNRLRYLEQIAAKLPPAERPAPFQDLSRFPPGEPMPWGVEGSAAGDLPYDPSDLDPTPRPGETPQLAMERAEWARVAMVFNELGDTPPRFDVADNDAAHASDGAHTLERHGPDVPLTRDPHTRTVEGRIYGDAPWPRRQNFSSRWLDVAVMNRAINEYVAENWQTIRADLALEGRHVDVAMHARLVGEGYANLNMGTRASPVPRYYLTKLFRVTLKLVPGSDPARAFVVTAFPESKRF